MTILDGYILRRYLLALGMALAAFIAIFVVLDLFEKLDDFIDQSVPMSVVFQYYLFRIPEILLLMLPIGMLLACLFSLGTHARNNELVAITSSGVSMRRALTPVLLCSLLTSLLALAAGETVAPPAADRVRAIDEEFLRPGKKTVARVRTNLSFMGEGGRLFWIGRLDSERGKITDVVVQTLSGNTLVDRIDAKEAVWEDKRWTFRDGYFRRFQDGELEEAAPFDTRVDERIIESPADLAKIQKNPRQMSYRELSAHIEKAQASGGEVQKELVDLHMKVAFPFTNFLIVMLGAPLASLLRRGGNALGFSMALAISFLYYLAIRVGQSLGYNGLFPSPLAAWAANILFGFFAVLLFRRFAKG